MAELLGIVAGGAGLASLALQLVDGGQRLRQRYNNVKSLGGNILWLSEDVELIGKQLLQFETSANDIMQEQLGPIMMGRCRDRCARVADRLANLAGDIPDNSSRRQIIRTTFRSGQWKGELDDLQTLVTSLKQDISQLYVIQQHLYMRNSQSVLLQVDNASSKTSSVSLSKEIAPHKSSPVTASEYQQGIVQHSICNCSCSCHKKRTISGILWHLQYSPLAEIFKACDNPACSVRRYRFDLQLTLYRYGIPLKAALGFDLITEPGRYSLQPCLQIETVVDFYAPGFVILEKLAFEETDWVTAETELKDLYQSCPGFVNQVAVNGFMRDKFYTDIKPTILESLIQLFVGSFHTKETTHSMGLLKQVHRITKSKYYTDYMGSLETLRCDFKNVVPTWDEWPTPFYFLSVPFDSQFMRAFLQTNPDFGDSPPLHASILFESDASFKLCLERTTSPFEKIVNFLGQSTLHVSVWRPQRMAQLLAAGHPVDLCDKNGVPPVMYAAAMNIPDAVMMLIRHRADICPRMEDFNILGLVAMAGNWDLIWQIVDFAAETYLDLIPALFRSLLLELPEIRNEACYAAHDPGGQNGCINFWSWVISKLGSPNFSFQDGTTLMQMTYHPKSARALIDLGFDKFDQEEGGLLVHIASLHDPSLFQFAVANGGDVHVRNDWGSVIVGKLLYNLLQCKWKVFPTFWDTLQFLVDRGAPILTPHESMCKFWVHHSGRRPMWDTEQCSIGILAWLEMVESKRPVGEAKEATLAALRQISFDEADLHHACCTFYNPDLDSNVNDRFWDIQEQIKIDELNRDMEELAGKAYPELKIEVMVRLRCQWRTRYELWHRPEVPPRARQIFRSRTVEEFNDLLEVIRTSEHPKIPEPFLSSWDGIIQKKLDSGHWDFTYDIELGLVKFGICLYQIGVGQFASWIPLLTQLTDILLAEEEPGAPKS